MDRQDTITIKAFLQRPGSYHAEIRRFPLTLTPASSGDPRGLFAQLSAQVLSSFPGLRDLEADLIVTWRDSDGDYVLMTSDEELLDAISEAKNKPLNIYITVETASQTSPADSGPFVVLNEQGYEEVEAEGPMEAPDAQMPQKQSTTTANNNEVDTQQVEGSDHPTTAVPTEIQCPPGPHHLPPPPPPPPVGFPWNLIFGPGPWSGRGRQCGFPGSMRRRGHFHGGPLQPWAHHHHHPMWHAGHPDGSGMGMGMRRGMFGRQHQGYMRMPGWQGGRLEGEGHTTAAAATEGCQPGRAEFRAMAAQVPFLQRRWAKSYIKQWRQKNLDNATNGGEGEKGPTMSMEEAQVTQAYVDWLEKTLPRFYKREVQAEASAGSANDLLDAESAVPVPFQKWCLWFLTWHKEPGNPRRGSCGLKVSFRGHDAAPSCLRDGCSGKTPKEWKKEWKSIRKEIKTAVPLKYRIWAKSYIKQWRRDHVISSHDGDIVSFSSTSSSSSESEDAEKTLPEVVDIPEDYRRWLNLFLTRWHVRREVIIQGGADTATGGMCQFKDSVPCEFRKWVKCFLNRHNTKKTMKDKHKHHHKRHHQHQNHHQHGDCRMYKKWMREQYRKWLENAGQSAWASSGSSSSSSSSSDEDAEDKQMASSFKRLRLNQSKDTYTGSGRQQTASSDGGISDPAMTSSDPLSEGNQEESAMENIPPQMQRLMTKMMMKMQAKQMKMAKKAAKRDMKAAWKAYKFSY